MDREKLISGVNLIKRLPPSKTHKNAIAISSLFPEQADDFMSKIDKPLEIGKDPINGNNYIQCEFNRDGDSYRSHWTNNYDPPLQDAVKPSQKLRELEVIANDLFQEYTKLYYQGGISSIYFWDTSNGNFACAFLVKKEVDHKQKIKKGTWDSINVIDIIVNVPKKVTYKISSSIVLEMAIEDPIGGSIDLSGSLTKAKEVTFETNNNDSQMDHFHLEKIGKLVEEMEGLLKQNLDSVYVGKTKESVFTVRSPDGSYGLEQNKKNLAGQLINMKKQ